MHSVRDFNLEKSWGFTSLKKNLKVSPSLISGSNYTNFISIEY